MNEKLKFFLLTYGNNQTELEDIHSGLAVCRLLVTWTSLVALAWLNWGIKQLCFKAFHVLFSDRKTLVSYSWHTVSDNQTKLGDILFISYVFVQAAPHQVDFSIAFNLESSDYLLVRLSQCPSLTCKCCYWKNACSNDTYSLLLSPPRTPPINQNPP